MEEENNFRKRKNEETNGSESENECLINNQNYKSLDILELNSIKVNKECVLTISEKSKNDVELIKKQNLKILKLFLGRDLSSIFDTLEPFLNEEYPKLFIFVIDADHVGFNNAKQMKLTEDFEVSRPAFDDLLDVLTCFGNNRPIVLQLTSHSEKTTKYYFKDEDSVILPIDLNQRNFEESLDFQTFLTSILHENLESVLNLVIENFTSLQNCSLILRFLRAFKLPEANFKRMILECASYGSINCFKACLDSHFENGENFSIHTAQTFLTTTFDDEKSSVLLSAIESNNNDVVDFLMKFCLDYIQQLPFDHQVKVSTSAFMNNNFKILCKLLDDCDFPFPDNLDGDLHNNEELSKIIERRKSLEIAINLENIDYIKEFVIKNPKLKIVYNTSNNSSLKQAADFKKLKSYYFLVSHEFDAVDFESIQADLLIVETKTLNKIKIQQFKTNIKDSIPDDETSVNTLCNKSLIHGLRISKEEELNYREKIRNLFRDIYKIKFGAKLLEIAASCEELKIIFDFRSHSVENTTLSNSGSEAVTYPLLNLIVIGSKLIDEEQEQRIKGILAHEICHFVMQLVYENNRNPYFKNNKQAAQIFENIVNTIYCSLMKSEDPDDGFNGLIFSVFRMYEKNEFHLELIVRVVQILAQYDNNEEMLNYFQLKYKDLFEYFETFVFTDMKAFNIVIRKEVREINKNFGLLTNLTRKKIDFMNSKDIESLINSNLTVVTSNIPILLLINLFKHFQEKYGNLYDAQSIFVDPEKLVNLENFKKDFEQNSKQFIIVDCSSGGLDKFKSLISINTQNSMLVIINESQRDSIQQIVSESKLEIAIKDQNYTWNDLTPKSQNLLLQTKINFQNYSDITLEDLIRTDEASTSQANAQSRETSRKSFSDIIDDELLGFLITGTKISINKKSENEKDERAFQFLFQSRLFRDFLSSPFTQKKLISNVKNEKYVLLSDIAGNGKSWAIKNISYALTKKYPTTWVTLIDLKQFIDKFKEQQHEKLEFLTFFIDKILINKKKFERIIFQKMYEIGKVFILFDGFDEIAPNYAEFVLKLAKSFKQNHLGNNLNQLWIATRDYFKVNLQIELNISDTYRLINFSTKNGVELIAKVWMLQEIETNHIESRNEFEQYLENSQKFISFVEMAKKLIEKMFFENRSIGMPQIYKMIAEISKDDKELAIKFSQAFLYKTLVQKLYERWASEKGDIRKQSNTESQEYDLNFYKFHQYLAIKSLLFNYIRVLFVGYNPNEWKNEEIIACGIVDFRYFEYQFHHETFREYFVADFMTKELKKSSVHEEALNMFAEVITTKKFEIVRMFLNETLESSVLRKIISEMQTLKRNKMFQDMDSFTDIFKRGLNNLVEFIVQVLRTRQGGKISSVITNCASEILQDSNHFSKFRDFLFTNCNLEFLNKLLTEIAVFLHLIKSELNFEYFESFYLNLKSKVSNENVKIGLKIKTKEEEKNIFYFLCKSPDFSFSKFKKFLDFLANQLSIEEIQDLMLTINKNETTILQYLFSNSKEPQEIWIEIENFYKEQNKENYFKELVAKKDLLDDNILMCSQNLSLDFYKQFLDQMFEMFDKEILKEMFMKINLNGENFMQLLIYSSIEDKIEHTILVLFEKFDKDYFKKLIEIKNKNRKSVIQIAVEEEFNNCQIYKILWENLKQVCENDEEFLKILNENKSWSFENILQVVAKNDTTCEVLEFMVDELEKFPVCDEIKKMLGNLGKLGNILLLNLGIREDCFELFKKLWKIYHKNFNLSNFLKVADNFLPNLISQSKINFIEYAWKEIELLKNQDKVQIAHYLRWTYWNYNLYKQSLLQQEITEWMENKIKLYKIDIEIEIFPEFRNKFENCIQSESHEELLKLLKRYKKIFKDKNLLDHYKYFLLTPNSNGQIFVFQSVFKKNANFTKTLWKEIFNISHWSELKSLKKKSSFDYILQIFIRKYSYGQTILYTIAAHSTCDILEIMFEVLEAIASNNQIKEIISYPNAYDGNLLHSATEYNKTLKFHEILWDFLTKYFKQEEMINLIEEYKYDKYGNSFDSLQLTVQLNTKEIVEFTWIKYKNLLDRSKQVKYLGDNFNKLFYFSNENKENLQEVQNWVQSILIQYPEILDKIKIDEYKYKYYFDEFNEKPNIDWIKKSLMTIYDEKNFFYYLCAYSSVDLTSCLNILQKYLTIEDILSSMKNCNNFGENIFHVLVRAEKGTEFVNWLNELLRFFNTNNLQDKFDELLEQTNVNNHNFLDISVFNNSIEFHKIIWNFLKDFLTNYEIFNVCVYKNDRNGNNFFHLLLRNSQNPAIIDYIFNILKAKLNNEEFKELLNYRGNQGKNLLQSAIINNNIEILKKIYRKLTEVNGLEISKILSEVDDLERNILDIAVCYSSGAYFELLVEYIVNVFSPQTIENVFFNNKSGHRFLNCAVLNNDLTLHEALWKSMIKFCDNSEIKNIINSTDQMGNNLLHNTVWFNCKQIAEFTWNKIKNFLDLNEQILYLNATGYESKKLNEMSRENKLYPDIQEWVPLLDSSISCTFINFT